ncbi:hypothetical protein ACFL0Q_01520 [Thermodesulfobacteriota bacterium]
MEKLYTTTTVTKLGIGLPRVKDWLERGFIKPSAQVAEGKGNKNLFTVNDLYLIKLFSILVASGFSRDDAAEKIKSIRGPELPAAEQHLWSAGKILSLDCLAFRKGGDVLSDWVSGFDITPDGRVDFHMGAWLADWTDIHLVNMKAVRAEVSEAIR